jgi:hypothetical protein
MKHRYEEARPIFFRVNTFFYSRTVDFIVANRTTPKHLSNLITTVDFLWPLSAEHNELRQLYDGPEEDGCRYPTEHPSDYPVIWQTIRSMLNLRRLRIDTLAMKAPLQYVLSRKVLVHKWLYPLDELLYDRAPVLKHVEIWVPDSTFRILLDVGRPASHPTNDKAPENAIEFFYRKVECEKRSIGYWVCSREDVDRIAESLFYTRHVDELWGE